MGPVVHDDRHPISRGRSTEVNRRVVLSVVVAALTACTTPAVEREPIPITPPKDIPGAAVIRRELPQPAAPVPTPVPPVASIAPSVQSPVVVPAGAQYVCVVEKDGRREQTTIQFGSKVAAMCQKHPEMGPCQYERNLCRRSGGRVYAANGVEITMATEAEYDKKVMRVRFKAN
jgi:hypothetical protein